MSLVIGLDLGTSGVRAVALDAAGTLVGQAQTAMPAPERAGARLTQDPDLWWQASWRTLAALCRGIDAKAVRALAVDGTSGSLLLCDGQGQPLSQGWMYNDASCVAEAARVAALAPPDSPAQGASSPLARLLHLQALHPDAAHVLHQADWIAARLCARVGWSDENNVLKLGYDVQRRCWPDWFGALGVRRTLLPQVQPPGRPLAPLEPRHARELGLPSDLMVCSGTTDGVAAFLATGATEVGDAVSSLGSTLVIKLLSREPVFAPAYGIYSHRLGDLWLPGGASNSGGAALLAHFSAERMAELTPRLTPDRPTGLDYYPLPAPGERFPVADPQMASRTTPRPDDEAGFFQALLEGVAGVERLAYERLAALGAPAPQRVFSVGGGARNPAFSRIRARCLGVPVLGVDNDQAAVGAARLARQGLAHASASEGEMRT